MKSTIIHIPSRLRTQKMSRLWRIVESIGLLCEYTLIVELNAKPLSVNNQTDPTMASLKVHFPFLSGTNKTLPK
jgi:hypothetical protein